MIKQERYLFGTHPAHDRAEHFFILSFEPIDKDILYRYRGRYKGVSEVREVEPIPAKLNAKQCLKNWRGQTNLWNHCL